MTVSKTLSDPVFSDDLPHLAIVYASNAHDISDTLLVSAQDALRASGASFEMVEMPSVNDIPTAIRITSRSGKFDGFVALGHMVGVKNSDCCQGIQTLALEGYCIGNGILTGDTLADVQAENEDKNIGKSAAVSALHLIALTHRFLKKTKGIGFKPASEHILMAGHSKDKTTA